MNDLISRTSLLKEIGDWWLSETPNGRVLLIGGEIQRTPAMKDIEQFMKLVEIAPTAYDVKSVVEQLEQLPNVNPSYSSSTDLIDREDAIEIVKGGAE